MMTLSDRELRALMLNQLAVLHDIMLACPANEMALADLKPNLQRLNEVAEAYMAASKAQK